MKAGSRSKMNEMKGPDDLLAKFDEIDVSEVKGGWNENSSWYSDDNWDDNECRCLW